MMRFRGVFQVGHGPGKMKLAAVNEDQKRIPYRAFWLSGVGRA